MNIVVWLRSLGLGKYEAAFRENEIDETVLPSLTHETLKELGVTATRHNERGICLPERRGSKGYRSSVFCRYCLGAAMKTPEAIAAK